MRLLIVFLISFIILIEAKPMAKPQEVQQIILEEHSPDFESIPVDEGPHSISNEPYDAIPEDNFDEVYITK